jgi:hypothetical protein
MYTQDLDERLNVLIFGVFLLCGGSFFSGICRLALINVGGGVEYFCSIRCEDGILQHETEGVPCENSFEK